MPAGDILQEKIDVIFKGLGNVFCFDNILIIGYEEDSRDHDKILRQMMDICQHENLKLNKIKCHFRCTRIPYFGEIISKNGVQIDPKQLGMLIKRPLSTNRKELQCFGHNELFRKVSTGNCKGM